MINGGFKDDGTPTFQIEGGLEDLGLFLEGAEHHTETSFHLLREECEIMGEIITLCSTLKRSLDGIEGERSFAPNLIDKSLCYSLAALRTAMAGQPAEAMPTTRAAIESALYVFQMVRCPSEEAEIRAQVYLDRQQSDDDRNASRAMYGSPSSIFARLAVANPALATMARNFYERTIDEGAHPNPLSVLPSMTTTVSDGRYTTRVSLLVADADYIKYAVSAVVKCALVSLSICAYAFEDRAAKAGMNDPLNALWRRIAAMPSVRVHYGQPRESAG